MPDMIKTTVIGGGTGTYTVLAGLKKYSNLDLKAIVNATDSGGSTGRLRDEYGILPVGDIRQCMVALAENGNGNNVLRKLLSYRFDKGELKGHNFGNLLITAITESLGNEDKAIKELSKVFNIKGDIITISNDNIDLVAEYDNGEVLVGESKIDQPDKKHDLSSKIINIKSQPKSSISERARTAILDSHYIILGPGDLYTSTLCNFVVGGAPESLQKSNAKLILVVSLMTRNGQTNDLTAQGYLNEVIKYTGRIPNYVIVNNTKFSPKVRDLYKEKNSYPVVDNLDPTLKIKVIRENVASEKLIKQEDHDPVKRSLVRHDSNKLARVLVNIMMNS